MEGLSEFWRRFRRNRLAVVGLVVVTILVVTALLSTVLVPFENVIKQVPSEALSPPSWAHPMGTDHLGRDVMSRIVYASRTSLLVGVMVVSIGMTIGTVLGLLAGYLGGWWERIIMRLVDIMLAFPFMLLAITVSATVGPWLLMKLETAIGLRTFSSLPVILSLGFATFPDYVRLVRGSVLSLREEQFVDAARALGANRRRIMLMDILPNLVGTLLVYGTLKVSTAILAESGLSFLGLGAQPPEPTWGNMLSEGREYLLFYAWLPLFPGIAILCTVLGFNFVGDGLRDVLDPHMKDV
ncbi:ABC transporter permease subunit [bacterium]|nr:ABC transporter permease subunit [bacterium]